MSNINNCTKFEDNLSKQSGLTSFKNGWRPSWKQDGEHKNLFSKFFLLDIETNSENLKMIS